MLRAGLCLFALVCCAAGQEDPKESGPLGLIIQYQCLPGQRVHLREAMIQTGLRDFEKWRQDGILSEYHVLFSRYVDSNSWDMLALVTFPNYSAVARWRRVEATMPGGLATGTASLTTDIETYPVDLMRQAFSEEPAAHPVYFVVPYTISVSAAEYLQYADDYVRPQFDGWIHEGILSGYQLFLQRYAAARPWDAMIFLKYKDDDSFGQREKIVNKVRAQLQSNPVWKAASDNKKNLRVEKEAIIADELGLGR